MKFPAWPILFVLFASVAAGMTTFKLLTRATPEDVAVGVGFTVWWLGCTFVAMLNGGEKQ